MKTYKIEGAKISATTKKSAVMSYMEWYFMQFHNSKKSFNSVYRNKSNRQTKAV